ncbi:MAG: epoxyqueuosine reductase QueH [Candidatus Omnitrophica bacterium]|nr:epoxyqueuosine reductase QueH [Candidatus Omnitrophota bacterium]
MKLLLHACCAPCALSVIDIARKDGYENITGFFDNPNIPPGNEYARRADETKKIIDTICVPYDAARYFTAVHNYDDPSKRCPECWRFRLESAARYAAEHGFDAFTTTLLSSPYQDHAKLREIGEDLCKGTACRALTFYYRDFRVDFRRAHDEARRRGIYCQNYCGCVFSLVEREERRRGRGTAGRAPTKVV